MSGVVGSVAAWLDPRELPGRAAAARARWRDDDAPPARRARRARAAHRRCPTSIPTSPRCSSISSARRATIAWQEGKAAFLFASEGCWSELPHLYARYGTTATAALIDRLKALEQRERRARLRLGHAGDRARLRRADDARRPRRADAAGLQQDAIVSRVAGRARRRRGHDRRRRRPRGAGGGDPSRDARSCSPRRSPTRWCARRISTRCATIVARRARSGARTAARDRLDDRHAVGVHDAAARAGRRRRARQRHQGARRAPTATSGATSPRATRASATR